MSTVYVVCYELQEFDDSNQMDSIWSARDKAQQRLNFIDAQEIKRIAEINKEVPHLNRAVCLPSVHGWHIEPHEVDGE